jgi:arylsulfatase A-like enzyme
VIDPAESNRPDIVLIMTDQQRFDQVGYASGGDFDTPNLDALAASGVVFDAAYSASTVCVPARNALLTGLQPHRIPTQENGIALREGFWTVAHALRDAGYETALIGKMHFAPIHSDHGFETMRMCEHLSAQGLGPLSVERDDTVDDYHDWLIDHGFPDLRMIDDQTGVGGEPAPLPFDAHPTSWVERETSEFLARRDRDRPLFLIISFPHPHAPYDPPEPYASMYDPDESVAPVDDYASNEGLPLAFQMATESSATRAVASDPARVRGFLATVRGLIKHIDDAIGRLVDQLDLTSTSLFFTSDHGDYAGHRGLMRKNPWISFDDLARVPLFACGAGICEGRRVHGPVQSFDLARTWLELAGVPVPHQVGSSSIALCGILAGDQQSVDPDRAVFSATTAGWPMVRRGSFKYIEHATHGKKGQAVLFDLDSDPGETVNLADDPRWSRVRRELEVLLDAERAQPILEISALPAPDPAIAREFSFPSVDVITH